MSVKFFYNPYDKQCRDKLAELQAGGLDLEIVFRTSPEHDQGFWISNLPTALVDDSGNEVLLIDDVKHMNKDTVKAMYDSFKQWKQTGKFPDNLPPGIRKKQGSS